jgi:hypothetical protein
MNASPQQIQLGLEDLLGDLLYARRRGDMGRLALLACFEVRRWARMAGYQGLADHASKLITHPPHVSREAFLVEVDGIIAELEKAHH